MQWVANIAWSAAILGCIRGPLFPHLRAQAARLRQQGVQFAPNTFIQLYQAETAVALEGTAEHGVAMGDAGTSEQLFGTLLEAGRAAWLSQKAWNQQLTKGRRRESYFQQSIAQALGKLGLQVDVEFVGAHYSIDLALREWNVAIEADVSCPRVPVAATLAVATQWVCM